MIACKICNKPYPDSSKWDRIRAWSEGWFVSYTELEVYCPECLPEWVIRWRRNR